MRNYKSPDGIELCALTPGRDHPSLFAGLGEAELFARYILSDEALTSKHGLDGIYFGASSNLGRFRVSDRTERIAVSVQGLLSAGADQKDACVFVASVDEAKLGQSRRGRPSRDCRKDELMNKARRRRPSRELMNKAHTVRAIWNFYRVRGFKFTRPLSFWVQEFHRWKLWVFTIDEQDFDFFTRMIAKKRGALAAVRFREAIEACRSSLPGHPARHGRPGE